ncbi:tyrosine-type recombinase/integrase [Bacteroidota bacterium]
MSLKGSNTTSGYIKWDTLIRITNYLLRKKDYKFYLLIRTGMFTGLRIGDILNLKWNDVLEKDYIELTEKKTKKFRRIRVNEELKKDFVMTFKKLSESTLMSIRIQNQDEYIFSNKYKTNHLSIQYVNTKLKEIVKKYKINPNYISSHSLRKSFGRRVWEMNNHSDKSLILLSELFNHSNIAVTRRYLGIRQSEIFDIYLSLE